MISKIVDWCAPLQGAPRPGVARKLRDNIAIDNQYKLERLANIYNDGNGWDKDSDFYLSLAADTPQRILDIGCGTGIICHAYAALGHHVTGLDPAASMLKVAKANANGSNVSWVQSTIKDFQTEQQFDLIIMTGHAFQCLLTTEDLQNCLQAMARYATTDSQIVFETRNPAIDWKSKWNNQEFVSGSGLNKANVIREVTDYSGTHVEFTTTYQFADETLLSESTLRFWDLAEIGQHAANAGLAVKTMYGDWDRTPFDPDTSEEIIIGLRLLPTD